MGLYSKRISFFFMLFILLSCSAEEILLYASFQKDLQPELQQPGSKIQWHGNVDILPNAGVVPGQNALFLPEGAFAEIPTVNLHQNEGTICFWYRPCGDPLGASHTYLSMPWNFSQDWEFDFSYMVFSQGWWEGSGGAGTTYFIYNNCVGASANKTSTVNQNQWSFYAISWKIFDDLRAQTRQFHNGKFKRSSISKKTFPASAKCIAPLYLGTDKGAGPLSTGRSANGLFQDFAIYSSFLSEEKLMELFRAKAPQTLLAELSNPWHWMRDAKDLPYREKRNAQGQLLESRIMFAEGNVIYTRDQARMVEELDRLKNSGYNVFMPLVWKGEGTEYDSNKFPVKKSFQRLQQLKPGWNYYLEFINEAHQRGLEVHSAFAVTRSGGNHAAWPEFRVPGHQQKWSNTYNPAFRRRIIELMVEHIREYPVDGINLDFIRIEDGQSFPGLAEEFQRVFERKFDPKNQQDFNLISSYCIADIVYEISKEARKIRPGIIISAAATPQTASQGLLSSGRNPYHWLEWGWVDFIFCMDYGKRLGVEMLDKARKDSQRPYGFIPGLGNYDWVDGKCLPRDAEILARLADYCRRKYNDGNGIGTYFWSKLDEAQSTALRNGPFKEFAIPSWRRNPLKKTLTEAFLQQD